MQGTKLLERNQWIGADLDIRGMAERTDQEYLNN